MIWFSVATLPAGQRQHRILMLAVYGGFQHHFVSHFD
jgi:hypothetical protein